MSNILHFSEWAILINDLNEDTSEKLNRANIEQLDEKMSKFSKNR